AAISSLSKKWSIESSATWNLTDPCSGPANSTGEIENPGIKCDCSSETVCHVTQMKVYALDKTGQLPEELAILTYLFDLNLAQNYFYGPMPAFLGNLTKMQYLSFGINNFSGPVSKELGKLTELKSLSFSSNNFNGTLPLELGKLTQLEQLYIDSAGVTGEIPTTFRNLTKLRTVWASDNLFTGEIPDFIGSWTDLTVLRLQGTALKGPIPSNFSSLTSLTSLRISDLTSGVSSLTFLQNLKNLTELVLRNNMISGEIPSYIGELSRLKHLDLSFNNFTGEFPTSLQNLSNLTFLFLGNNNLSGKLPSQKSSSLQYIDLSYNRFSGALPTWFSGTNSSVNLVGNYLEINETDNGLASRRLACLQRTFPCNRGAPRYSHFAINCGGQQMTSRQRIDFESDNETLGPASFYVTDTQRWGVSNSGNFMDSSESNYTKSNQSQFKNTLDTELYQTARLSPSSLRYYGLGLENGPYTVNLQFAEIDIEDTGSWKSLGKRIFDVSVQGNKILTNFNIQKQAGGSNIAVEQSFSTSVTENYLEIHFLWTGKGTCCITTQGTYGPLISAISVTPEFTPTVTDLPPSNSPQKKIKTGTVIGIIFSAMAVVLICLVLIIFWHRRVQKSLARGQEKEALKGIQAKPNIFSYTDMKTATRDFHEENKLGQGGFGTVYKGIFPDGKLVAVKQLSSESKQGKREFINEVAAISAVQHRNLVKLHGCCVEGEHRILVYECLENNSLAQALFGNSKADVRLDWPTRYNICIGTARGLAYLHEESSVRIVHRDIKASNILLDNSLNPKIADFGLAKLFDETKTHISTRVAGTVGYMAPEYAMRGHLTEKADVFSFGVVALEVVSGRINTETTLPQERVYLLEWTWHLHEQKRLLELMDPQLSPTYTKEEVLRVIAVALLCTQALPAKRPSMSRVVAMLTGHVEEIPLASRPGYITDWQYSNHTAASGSTSMGLTPKHKSTEILPPATLFSPGNTNETS
ncbi:hypothetical protein KI387_032013, partial [Taxus chinensis]